MSDKDRSGRSISDPDQIAMLASPVRQEIVDTLIALGGEAPVAALAEQLGRPADTLYYHLRLLSQAGMLEEFQEGGATERRYRIAGGPGTWLQLEYRPGDRANTEAVERVVRSLLRIAGRDFQDALADADVVVDGPARELWAARNKGWVSGRELEEINRLLIRLCALLRRPRKAGRDTLVSLAFVLAPLTPQPKRRGSN